MAVELNAELASSIALERMPLKGRVAQQFFGLTHLVQAPVPTNMQGHQIVSAGRFVAFLILIIFEGGSSACPRKGMAWCHSHLCTDMPPVAPLSCFFDRLDRFDFSDACFCCSQAPLQH